MNASAVINIILCILSFILAAISVITVVLTLRQNHKMIKNSTRPYIVVTGQKTNFQEPMFYIVLKNYGTSGATITQLAFDVDLQKYSVIPQITPFEFAEGLFLAPGQVVSSVLDKNKLMQDNIEIIHAKINYTDGLHDYCEDCPINYKEFAHNVSFKAATKDKELRTISYALQELVERQF